MEDVWKDCISFTKKKKKIAFHIENSPSQLDKSEPLILTTILRLRKKKNQNFCYHCLRGKLWGINSYESDM